VLKHIRQNSLTSLRYSAAHRGEKPKRKPSWRQQVAHHENVDRKYNSIPAQWCMLFAIHCE